MDAKPNPLDEQQRQSIDRAVELLIRLLTSAAGESRHGTVGLRVSIHDGQIRNFHETSEFTTK